MASTTSLYGSRSFLEPLGLFELLRAQTFDHQPSLGRSARPSAQPRLFFCPTPSVVTDRDPAQAIKMNTVHIRATALEPTHHHLNEFVRAGATAATAAAAPRPKRSLRTPNSAVLRKKCSSSLTARAISKAGATTNTAATISLL